MSESLRCTGARPWHPPSPSCRVGAGLYEVHDRRCWRQPARHGDLANRGPRFQSIHGSSMSALHQAPSRTGRAAAATAPPPEPPPPASPAPPPPARAPRQRGTPPEAREPANGGGPHPPGARQSRSSRCAAREIDGARQWLRGPSGSVASGAPPPWPVPPRTPEARNLEAPGTPAPTGPKRPQTVPSRRTAAPDTGSRTLTPPGPTREHSQTVIQSLKVPP